VKAATLHELEPAAEWRAADVADPEAWTLRLSADDHGELDVALAVAKHKSADPLELARDDFPLDHLATKLSAVVGTLLDGRGFARIAALQTDRYDDDDLTLLYWGIGLHLGEPWAQNKYGHVLGDVTDQGKTIDDPTVRGNELGGVALDYHTDGSDLVGLLCLRTARSGGLSCVANAVAIHNHLVRRRPDLAAALYEPLPYDARGEQADGAQSFYSVPAFTAHAGRLFVRFTPSTCSPRNGIPTPPGSAPRHGKPSPPCPRWPTTRTSTSPWTCSRARCSSSTTTTCCTAAPPTRTMWRRATSATSSACGWLPLRSPSGRRTSPLWGGAATGKRAAR